MRIASRIIGVVLALAGFGFVVLPGYVFALGQLGSDWIFVAFAIGVGIACLLAGRYFLRLDFNEPEEVQDQLPSRFAPFFIAHRRELKVIAQIGLVISLIRFGAACFGVDWQGRWGDWILVLWWIGLVVIRTQIAKPQSADHIEWGQVPQTLRPVLKAVWWAGGAIFVILMLLFGWNQWAHLGSWPILRTGFAPLLFAGEVLFFNYGQIRSGENAG